MEKPLTEAEIEFCEHFFDPTSLTENLIPVNENAPQTWGLDTKCITLRDYELPMQNYSYLYADDPKLSDKENFRIKKGAGDCFNFSARGVGKSYLLKIDVILSIIHKIKEGCLASFDAQHLKKIADQIAAYVESHDFLKIFHLKDSRNTSVKRNPLTVITEHGSLIKSVNEKVEGNNPGVGFHQLHYQTLYYEEFSYASDEGTQKRIDSGHEYGHIERPSGIPDLCIGSPMGKIMKSESKKNWRVQVPQYVRESWDEKEKQDKIDKYNGEKSASFKLNVEAETVEGAFGFYDMARLKEASLNKNKRVKFFELSKENFEQFKSRIIVDRISGAEKVYVAADMGFGAAPSEIIIIFFDGKKYKYMYNIALYRLIQKEQAQIFKWLYDRLGGAFISIDSTSDEGVTIDYLKDMGIPIDHMLKVKFNKNIEVGIEKDEDGNPEIDGSGEIIMKEENTRQLAFKELEKLMYSGVMNIPVQEKFLNQFTNTIAKQAKNGKMIYDCKGPNHLHSAFEVFAVSRFVNEFNTMKNQRRVKRSFGVTSEK